MTDPAREELAEAIDAWLYQQCGPTLAKGHMLIDALLDGWKSPAEHDARVAELLAANNVAVQDRRDVEHERDAWRGIVADLAKGRPFTLCDRCKDKPVGEDSKWVMVPIAAMKWLFGEGPDDRGCEFGEGEGGEPRRSAFWWRRVFRRMTGWKS